MHTRLANAFLVVLLLAIGCLARAEGFRVEELKSEAIGPKTVEEARVELKLNVLLPKGYEEDSDRRYPVVYLLHGYGGNFREWERIGVAEQARDLAVILVMPEGDRSFWVNAHESPEARWEDWIVKEVVPHVDRTFRTIPHREGRAISGLSMGGYGAMILGLRHPDLFASIASHSGALNVPAGSFGGEIGQRLERIFGPAGSESRSTYDPLAVLEKLAAEKRPHLYIDCGSSDFLLEANRAFVRELARRRIDYEYREVPGGHDFAYWKRNVRVSLERQLAALEEAMRKAPDRTKESGSDSSGSERTEEAKDMSGGDSDDPRGLDAAKDAEKEARAAPRLDGDWNLLVSVLGRELDYTLRVRRKGDEHEAVLISPRSGEHPVRSVRVDRDSGRVQISIDRRFLFRTIRLDCEGSFETSDHIRGTVTASGEDDRGTFEARRAVEEKK